MVGVDRMPNYLETILSPLTSHPSPLKNYIMSTPIKKETWKLIVQLIVSIATAIAATLGVTSCIM